MSGSLHMLGATSDGLAAQNIVAHIVSIDGDVLKKKLADLGQSSAIAPAALLAINQAPKMAVDAALPFLVKELKEFGVTAELKSTNTSPPARERSEFIPGVVVGAGVFAVVAAIGLTAWKLLFRRLFT